MCSTFIKQFTWLSFISFLILESLAEKREKVVGEFIAETGFYQSIALTDSSPILKKKSKFQDISIETSDYYGKILVLDGVVQLTERDADSYNEMMAHIPLFAHPSPKRVLVIGGGDGYVVHEVLKHPSVVQVDHVDLDKEVIDVCREYFSWGSAWDDSRVNLHIADGSEFVRNSEDGFYDVVIQDSSDPFTWADDGSKIELPSNVLYDEGHFKEIHRILSPDGVFNFQAETFNIPDDLEGIHRWREQALRVGFKNARYGSLTISSYPTGQIGFILCEKEKGIQSISQTRNRFSTIEKKGDGTSYYQPKLQQSSFDLPLWVERAIYLDSTSDNSEL